MDLTFKYRLLPKRQQHVALESILEDQRQLYNAALEERIDCYRKTGKTRTYMDQCKALTEWRQGDVVAANTAMNIQRWTLRRLDNAYALFFRHVRSAVAVGFPQFRSSAKWHSFGAAEMPGVRFDGKRLRFKGMPGGLRVHMSRPLPEGASIRSCVFTKDAKGWSICLQIRVEAPAKRTVKSAVGIDVGIKTLVATSDGLLIPNPRVVRRAEKKMRIKQRALARCKRGSRRRQKVSRDLARLHGKIVNARATGLHQISSMLTKRYDLIAVEALNIKEGFNESVRPQIHDAGWKNLKEMIRYKAEKVGAHFVEVDPRLTSQTCPSCGNIAKKTLKDRVHACDCGCELDRDVAAAKMVLIRAVKGPRFRNVIRQDVRGIRKAGSTKS